MDNKLSELTNNARKAANSFYNWSQLANCTSERVSCLTVEQLKETSELLSALLAELETERASREQWQRNCQRTEERAERLDSMLTESVQALKAAEQRIAELEAIRADASQVFKEIGNELGCNPDNESIMIAIDDLKAIKSAGEKLVRCKGRYHSEQNYRELAALFGVTTPDLPPVDGDSETVIAELRARLATPVRLPEPCVYEVNGTRFYDRLSEDEVIASLREQGFTVEGG